MAETKAVEDQLIDGKEEESATESAVKEILTSIRELCSSGAFVSVRDITDHWTKGKTVFSHRRIVREMLGMALRLQRDLSGKENAGVEGTRIFIPIKGKKVKDSRGDWIRVLPTQEDIDGMTKFQDAHLYMAGYGPGTPIAIYEGRVGGRSDYFVEAAINSRGKQVTGSFHQLGLILEAGERGDILDEAQMGRLCFFFEKMWDTLQERSKSLLSLPGFERLSSDDLLQLAMEKELEVLNEEVA